MQNSVHFAPTNARTSINENRYISVLLVAAAALTAAGIGFSIAAVISPTWEVVLMREFQTEHEHGLWWDCARSVKTGIVNGRPHTNYGERHCTYKFDFTYNEKYPLLNEVLDKSVPDAENANHVDFKRELKGYAY